MLWLPRKVHYHRYIIFKNGKDFSSVDIRNGSYLHRIENLFELFSVKKKTVKKRQALSHLVLGVNLVIWSQNENPV